MYYWYCSGQLESIASDGTGSRILGIPSTSSARFLLVKSLRVLVEKPYHVTPVVLPVLFILPRYTAYSNTTSTVPTTAVPVGRSTRSSTTQRRRQGEHENTHSHSAQWCLVLLAGTQSGGKHWWNGILEATPTRNRHVEHRSMVEHIGGMNTWWNRRRDGAKERNPDQLIKERCNPRPDPAIHRRQQRSVVPTQARAAGRARRPPARRAAGSDGAQATGDVVAPTWRQRERTPEWAESRRRTRIGSRRYRRSHSLAELAQPLLFLQLDTTSRYVRMWRHASGMGHGCCPCRERVDFEVWNARLRSLGSHQRH